MGLPETFRKVVGCFYLPIGNLWWNIKAGPVISLVGSSSNLVAQPRKLEGRIGLEGVSLPGEYNKYNRGRERLKAFVRVQ